MSEDKLIKLSNVMEYVQISKTKIYDLMKIKKFPKPLKIGGNSLWYMSDIQAYIEKTKKQEVA